MYSWRSGYLVKHGDNFTYVHTFSNVDDASYKYIYKILF
jgi:hypothetical protein